MVVGTGEKISEALGSRTPIQCLHRWTKILQPGLVKGPWTIEEDRKLTEWVKKEGPIKWSQCAEFIKGRNGKQCRERWFNSLNPEVKKGNWTVEEDFKIFFLYKKFGGKWTKIVSFIEGRTENSIKNRFYSRLQKRYQWTKKKKFICLILPANLNQNKFMAYNSDGHSQSIISNPVINEVNSIGLDELLKYFPEALEEVTNKFKKLKDLHKTKLKLCQNNLFQTIEKNNRHPKYSFKIVKPEFRTISSRLKITT